MSRRAYVKPPVGAPIAWPENRRWLHDYALARADAVHEYKAAWDARLYRLHGRIFALLLESPDHGLLLNLKCDPYLSLHYRQTYPGVLPGWHMNKVHWLSLVLGGDIPEDIYRELVDHSYESVLHGLPKKLREQVGGRPRPVPL